MGLRPQPVSCLEYPRCAVNEWQKSLLPRCFLDRASAANFVLRARAARMSDDRGGLKQDLRCVVHQRPVRENLRFAAACLNSQCVGQTGLLLAQLLLMQHPLAGAARSMLHCSQGRQSGHSTRLDDVNPKLHFRCVVHELEGRGRSRHCAAAARRSAML